jgi:PEP-CTERM motif
MKTQLLSSGLKRLVIPLAFAVIGVVPVSAQPSWYNTSTQSGIEPGSPDFYQHQPNENPAFSNGGYCAYFAFEDAMYYDANNGFANLYANNANWVTGMNNNFNAIFNTAGPNLASQYDNYIANQGYGASMGVNTLVNSFAGGYSMYNAIQANLFAGSNVLILTLPGTTANPSNSPAISTNQWWSFHVMDVVGMSATNHNLVVLDPDNNQYGGGGFPGSGTNPPTSGVYTNSYGVGVPYNLAYYNTNEAIPIANGWGNVGGPTNSALQMYSTDATGDITSGIYDNTYIAGFFAIGPVPEPSSTALALVGAAVLGGYWRARRKPAASPKKQSRRD